MITAKKMGWDGDFDQESWKEYFTIQITWEARQLLYFKVPFGYFFIEGSGGPDEFSTDNWTYWIWYLVPFVKAMMFIKYHWFKTGRFFRRRGFLNLVENEAAGWFWPSKFKMPNRYRWCSAGGIHKIDSGTFYQMVTCRKCGMCIYNR